MNDLAKNVVLWIVIAVVLATVVSNFSSRGHAVQEMPYSAFLSHVKDGSVTQVTFQGDKISQIEVYFGAAYQDGRFVKQPA